MIKVQNLSRSFKQYKKSEGVMASIKSVFKRDYYDIHAVKEISFEINPGEVVGFIGPNGAGKTTTLKMLSGILHPSSGEVEVFGYKPYERNHEYLKMISLVMGQKSQLWWELPPMDGFTLQREIYQIDPKQFTERVEYLAELLEIKDVIEVPLRKLSLGQRMKSELVASILHNPKILYLDEPTIGLDIVVQKKIRQFLKEINQEQNTTIMLTSHYMEDVQELCNRVIVIAHGEIVFDGGLNQLKREYANSKYLNLTFNKPVTDSDISDFGELVSFTDEGLNATLAVPVDQHTKVASAVLQKFDVDDLDIAEVKLEDIIEKIFEQT